MHGINGFGFLSGIGDNLVVRIPGSIDVKPDVGISQILIITDFAFNPLNVNVAVTKLYEVFLPSKIGLPLLQDRTV